MNHPQQHFSDWAFIALGSNLGTSEEILRLAFHHLQHLSPDLLLQSSFWKTSPVDCPPDSPPFINAVAGLKYPLQETPEHLLEELLRLEATFGTRKRLKTNEPRFLDLDLITYGNQTRHSSELILPHPRAHLRKFVLAPLAEIAPGLFLPGQEKNVRTLLDELVSPEKIERIEQLKVKN